MSLPRQGNVIETVFEQTAAIVRRDETILIVSIENRKMNRMEIRAPLISPLLSS